LTTRAAPRYCRCGTFLATDNPALLCAACQRATRDKLIAPPVVPSSFWATDELHDAFVAQHMGRVSRAYRKHPFHVPVYGRQGITQALLGQWIGLSQPQINRIEHGTAQKHIDSLTRWARVLRIPPELLWFDLPGYRRHKAASVNELFNPASGNADSFQLKLSTDDWTHTASGDLAELLREGAELPITTDTVSRLVHEWLVIEPPQLVEVAAGRSIGDGLVVKVERRVAQLRRMDDFVAGGDLHELVERELRTTTSLLREAAYSEVLGRRLLVAIGELCQLAGWVMGDAGSYSVAAHYYSVGVKAAHAAGDTPLAANLISTLSYQVSNVGNPREALLLAQSADTGAKHQATPTTRALFKERVAWANAKVGDRKQAERALAAVETDYEHRMSDDDPEWVYWLNEDEINVMAGRCYVELGVAERAVPLLSGVLNHYDERMTRERALYLSWLAEAQVMVGDIEEAAATATKTLELTAQVTSARSDDRVKVLRRKLKPYREVPAVADFEAQALGIR
jgi:transcriptional regulator with XRE-family HTH domain/tetratricopeptide (TPR) repeat protein